MFMVVQQRDAEMYNLNDLNRNNTAGAPSHKTVSNDLTGYSCMMFPDAPTASPQQAA